MQYPVNFDFGTHWKTKIVKFLDNKEIKKAVRNGINKYLALFPTNKKYRKNTVPASYTSKDCYAGLMERCEEIKMSELRKSNKLPKYYLDLESTYDKVQPDTEESDELLDKLICAKNKIMAQYFSWENVKYNLETYYVSGACHSWAPTFELTLANLVEPEENWRVQKGITHSTVINETNNKIFDLLYWCDGGRLDNYIFGDNLLVPIDPTFGGKDAFIDSLSKN